MQKQYKKDLKYGTILGVKINSTSTSLLPDTIRKDLDSASKKYIVTPNSEIVVMAQEDPELLRILNSADISIADGVGLNYAASFLGLPKFELIPGRKMMVELFKIANSKKLKVFLLGSTPEAISRSLDRLNREYPGAIALGKSGPRINSFGKPETKGDLGIEKELIAKINNFYPDFLFVAFGAPKQEKWIDRCLPKLNVGYTMTVGGSLDYFSGTTKVPPAWMEGLGLEWLWRVIREPKRIGRIIRATILFPLYILRYRLFQDKL